MVLINLDLKKPLKMVIYHERKVDGFDKVSPCTYLTPMIEVAKDYGDVVLEVEYDPYSNPEMNNYIVGGWQFRVYEPIYTWKVVQLAKCGEGRVVQ